MQRNQAIDVIRGVLLLLMTINHFFWGSGTKSPLQLFSLQPLGQFGAAEGFIFISGLMVGLIYTRPKAERVAEKLRQRSVQIYGYHIGAMIVAFLILYVVMQTSTSLNKIGYYFFPWLLESPVVAGMATLTLVHKPPFFDILPMYIAFLFVSPLVIHALKQGRLYSVIAVSVVLWLASDHLMLSDGIKAIGITWPINTGYFNWFAWQMLFFAGVVIGYVQHTYHPNWFSVRAVTVFVGLFAFVVALAHHNLFARYGVNQGTLYELADKQTLGWLRLACLGAWVYLIGALISWKPNALNCPPLALLGRNSLQVFTAHYVLVYLGAPMVAWYGQTALGLHLLLALVIAGLFLCAYLREHKWVAKMPTRNA